jgi:hypothetical protein
VGHVAQVVRCADRRCHTDATRHCRAHRRNSVVHHPVGTRLHQGASAGCNRSSIVRLIRRSAAVARSNPRHVAGDHSRHPPGAADDHLPCHRVAVSDYSTRRSAWVGHSTRRHEALDQVSPAVGQFEARLAGRCYRRRELHLSRHPGCHSDLAVPCVPAVADVRSLRGVGRTA